MPIWWQKNFGALFLDPLVPEARSSLLARSALAAQRRLDAGASGADAEQFRQKIVTARFYCDQILPQSEGLLPAVTAGPSDLAAAAF